MIAIKNLVRKSINPPPPPFFKKKIQPYIKITVFFFEIQNVRKNKSQHISQHM